MRRTTRNITISAVMTAFAVALLYLASILPAERMGIVAVSSLFGIAAVIEAGIPAGVFVFLGGSLIGWLLVPYKPVILLYALFLGYYPVVKSLAEKLKNKVLQWAVKLAVFNLAFTALWFLFSALVFGPAILKLGTGLVYPVGNLVFILYDIGLTRLIGVYIVRISKNLRKNKE